MTIPFLLLIGAVHAGESIDVYKTETTDQEGGRLKLRNDAEIEIRGSRFQSGGSIRESCILFRSGMRWQIWIERHGLYDCDVDEKPQGSSRDGELVRILDIKYDGEVVLMEDGSIYEVDLRDANITSRWSAGSEAVIIEGALLVNLAEDRGPIGVRILRESR